MELRVCIDGVDHATVPLIDGNDTFNAEAERGALDRAYEAATSNPDAVVSVVVDMSDEHESRAYLTVRYDVTELDTNERESLAGEAAAQAERSEGHPSVEVEFEWDEPDDGRSE